MSETHITTDGRGFTVYTERASDRRRFTLAWGPPTRLGREGACAWWEGVPMGALNVKPKTWPKVGADVAPLAGQRRPLVSISSPEKGRRVAQDGSGPPGAILAGRGKPRPTPR